MDSQLLQITLALSIFAILFSIGMGLSLDSFKQIIKEPKGLYITLGCQVLLLPLIAIIVIKLYGLNGLAATGLLLLAVCPGGVSSNVFTRLSGGFTALSVALTAINSMLAVVTIPSILFIGELLLSGEGSLVQIPLDYLFKQLLLITFLPVTLGMLTRHFAPNASPKIEKVLLPLTSILFFVLIFYFWATEFEVYKSAFKSAGLPALTLFVSTCVLAIVVAKMVGLVRDQRIAMVYEVAIQNPPVAFFIAINILNDPALTAAAAAYAVIMTVVAILSVPFFRRQKAFP